MDALYSFSMTSSNLCEKNDLEHFYLKYLGICSSPAPYACSFKACVIMHLSQMRHLPMSANMFGCHNFGDRRFQGGWMPLNIYTAQTFSHDKELSKLNVKVQMEMSKWSRETLLWSIS